LTDARKTNVRAIAEKVMTANILEFKIRPDRKSDDTALGDGTNEIIIFPGVRFERLLVKPPSRAIRRAQTGSVTALATEVEG
jgi:hypothetical protein